MKVSFLGVKVILTTADNMQLDNSTVMDSHKYKPVLIHQTKSESLYTLLVFLSMKNDEICMKSQNFIHVHL